MALHVIVGAGPVGTALAHELLGRDETVRVITRSGSGAEGAERIAADAADAARLADLCTGAAAIYNCVNPPYHRWAQDWPPVAAALLHAAESSGAVLAITGNLYGYGSVHGPMTEQTPLAATGVKGRVRVQMWRDALAAHEAGRVRTFEVRGSDYLGGNSILSTVIAPAWRNGKRALVPAPLHVPHTFTDVRDVAALLAAGAADERAWGKAWHVPSPDPITIGELADLAAADLGVTPKLLPLPYAAVWTAGLFDKFVRELRETQHQFRKPFVLDSSAAQATFGLAPHAIEDSVRFDLSSPAPAKR
jgi:nucleoside-diphosphate-sugar epimerase